jgi:hypothetical protein
VKLFHKVLKESGVNEDLARNIMKQFADQMTENEENMRRDAAKAVTTERV